MRKTVNFRVSLFIAVGIILGIFSFYELLFGDFYFVLVSAVMLLACGTVFAFLHSKAYRVFAVILVFLLLGFGVAQLSYNNLTPDEAFGERVELRGRVAYYCDGSDGFYRFYLEDCTDADGRNYRGRTKIGVFYDGDISVGDNVSVTGELYSVYPIQAENKTYLLRDRIRYEMLSATVTSVSAGKMNVGESVRAYIRRTVQDYMPICSEIGYSLLTGDRSYLPSNVEYYFTQAGIIHLLAVSGLHVGFIVALLCFAFKRFRLRPVVEWALVTVPLIFYAYVCNFTPSVVRAVIMVCCGYCARTAYGRYDLLTSLSWAVAVILVLSPFSLFDVGFQLSALSVFGIAALYSQADRFLRRRRIPSFARYIVNSLTLSASCSLSTVFTVAVNFGKIPTLGVLVNLVAIPIVTFAFVVGLVGLLPWVFHYVLYSADMVLTGLYSLSVAVGELPFSSVTAFATALCVIVAPIWCFIAGGYVNLGKIGKVIAHSLCFAAMAACVCASFVKYAPNNQAYVCYGYDDCIVTVTSTDGDMVIVGEFNDAYAAAEASDYARKYKVKSCVLYFTDYKSCKLSNLQMFLDCLPIDKAYVLDSSYNAQADEFMKDNGITVVRQAKNTVSGGVITTRSLYNGVLAGVTVTCGELDVALIYGDSAFAADLVSVVDYADVYALADADYVESEAAHTTLSRYQTSRVHNYGANKYGNFTIEQKGGTIKLRFR